MARPAQVVHPITSSVQREFSDQRAVWSIGNPQDETAASLHRRVNDIVALKMRYGSPAVRSIITQPLQSHFMAARDVFNDDIAQRSEPIGFRY
jgi:hypothetical protein